MDRQERIDFILDHFEKPRYKGKPLVFDAVASSSNPGCGDAVTVYLTEDDSGGHVTLAFEGEGCTISQAAASMVMEMMQGWTLGQIVEATPAPLLALLGPDIAATRDRCALLAFNAVKHASRQLTGQSVAADRFEPASLTRSE